MNRNYATLLTVSVFFGLGLGVYEFALPYFLDAHGVSVPRMGLIYGLAAIFLFAVRVYAGDLSDRFGRKALYGASVAGAALVSALTPLAPLFWLQTGLRSLRDAAGQVFDTMYQLVLHEEGEKKYLDRVGKTRGVQSLAEAVAALGTGFLLARALYARSFHLSAAAFAIGGVVFLVGYRAAARGNRKGGLPSLRGIWTLDLPRPLAVLALSSFVFTVGLSTSHCFVMQLFWSRRFDAAIPLVGTILMLHRFTIGVPLLVVGWAVRRHLKQIFIVFVVLEGAALAASGLIPSLFWAAAVWLTHDFFGAGIWIPIQSRLIQKYSREETRGRDVSKVFAYSSLGWVFGPLLAGAVFERWYGGPFVLSGTIMMMSALVLLGLKDVDD